MAHSRYPKRSLRITDTQADVPRDVRDEIEFHLEMRAQELVDQGWEPEAARAEARTIFGDRQRIEQQCRALSQQVSRRQRLVETFHSFFSDIRHALRYLCAHPSYFASVTFTLALAMSLVTAASSVVYGVVLRPLPFAEPDRVVTVFNNYPKVGALRSKNSFQNYLERQHQLDSVEDFALYSEQTRSVGEPGAVRREFSMTVTPSFFRVLGIHPRLGSFLAEEQIQPGQERQVVIGSRLWRERFGASSEVIGRILPVDGEPHIIAGVMPEGFAFPGWDAQIWLPQVVDSEVAERRLHGENFKMFARLQPGATVEGAQTEMDLRNAAALSQLPSEIQTRRSSGGFGTRIVGFHEDLVRDVRGWLLLLLAGAVFVLVIACVSISGLQLIHTTGRLRDLATRFVLGASRLRLWRQLLTESLVLAVLGGGAGIALGAFSLGWWLHRFETWEIPRIDEVSLGGPEMIVLAAGAFAAMVASTLMGVFAVSRRDLFAVMREGSATPPASSGRWQGGLVAAQVTVAMVLLVGAALMIVSLRNLLAIDLGFEERSVVAAAINPPTVRYPNPEAQMSLFDAVLAEAASMPGVRAVALTSRLPFSEWDEMTPIVAEGQRRDPGGVAPNHHLSAVSSDFFEALHIPTLQGRTFDSGDDRSAQPVVILSREVARRYWPEGEAVGKKLFLGSEPGPEDPGFTVVGVVGDIVQEHVTETAAGAIYLPLRQFPRGFVRVVMSVEGAGGAGGVALEGLRERLAILDTELPLFWYTDLEERVATSLMSYRLPMQFLSLFAAIALFLAAVGVFGVLSRSVALRSKEIGIRLALGSSRGAVCSSILRGLIGFVSVGLVAGVGVALAFSRILGHLVYGVSTTEPAVFAAAALVIAAVAALAAVLPAQRAGRIDPVRVLASE
ncbi:MAG: ADOP family duplicated permease [Acidobacteriota bacterium]